MTFNSEILIGCFEAEAKDPKDNKEVSNPDDLELELENLEINDDALELEGADEAEDLTKKLLDEQGEHGFSRNFPFFISFSIQCSS